LLGGVFPALVGVPRFSGGGTVSLGSISPEDAMTIEIVEITEDNHLNLMASPQYIGQYVVRRPGATTIMPTHAAALDHAQGAAPTPLTFGECLPIGGGRRWMLVED
jgi:hypothetical protein